MTTKARSKVAAELRTAGLQILSDPASEPLVVRKLAPARAPQQRRTPGPRVARAWWRRPWAIAVGALVLLFLIVGALSSGDPSAPSESAQAAQESPAVSTSEPTATPAPTEPPQTISDARAAVRDDDYAAALLIAAALGRDDERGIERRIARRLAYRVQRALSIGDRAHASQLLRKARAYPRTSEIGRAAKALDAAQARAAARRKAQAIARAQHRARVQARRIARAEARRRAQAAESAPAVPAAPEAPTSGPSTTNWCGKRDGDGDGIYCEGL